MDHKMTMREKIARAIEREVIAAQPEPAEWAHYLAAADAVLETMREPTPGMLRAGSVVRAVAMAMSDADNSPYGVDYIALSRAAILATAPYIREREREECIAAIHAKLSGTHATWEYCVAAIRARKG